MSSLVTLSIENFVLIKQAQIEFAPGLNIISGQTGAGKSLLLKALMFILGERLNASQVLGKDGKKASVEAYFEIDSAPLRRDLRDLGLPEDWDGEELIISRSMDPSGRSRVRIAGRLATLTTLRSLAKRLVSILSQHAYQQLVKPELQNRVLDHFGQHFQTWTKFLDLRARASQMKTEIEELHDHQVSQQAYLRRARDDFEVLENLQPKEDEYDELNQEAETLRRAEELRGTLLTVLNTLSERRSHATLRHLRTTRRPQRSIPALARPRRAAPRRVSTPLRAGR
ncbi:MAG: AAA family ATPase [Planctomycetota bacterium]|nr:AAA family ATPase [Planctomycetota bacterium]